MLFCCSLYFFCSVISDFLTLHTNIHNEKIIIHLLRPIGHGHRRLRRSINMPTPKLRRAIRLIYRRNIPPMMAPILIRRVSRRCLEIPAGSSTTITPIIIRGCRGRGRCSSGHPTHILHHDVIIAPAATSTAAARDSHSGGLAPSIRYGNIAHFHVPNDTAVTHAQHGDPNGDHPHKVQQFGTAPSRFHDEHIVVYFLQVGIVGIVKVIGILALSSIVAMPDDEDTQPEKE
mmetsp:Transcript_983/g.1928  ORF Transcript_983/g.1928 Transcript_983/m.1928 type:complete len:231 (+) Transcript_983:366-1058(+)